MPMTNSEANLTAQLTGIGAILGFVFITSFIIWAFLKGSMGIRVSEEHEYEGVDLTECGLEAYPEFTSTRGA